MRKIIYMMILVLLTTSCEKYELNTYPTLDGTYRVSSVTMTINEDQTTHYINSGESVWFPSVDGPLEEMVIDETKLHFSGNKLYAGFVSDDWGSSWTYDFNIRINSDLVTGRWTNFTVTDYAYPRNYNIIEDGLEYLKINRRTQYTDINDVDIEVEYSITLYREGP